MSMPLISIIIPTYNRAHLIGETLDSVLTQSYSNWECIIVDDGSTDDTKEFIADYIKKDKRFQYHSRPIEKIKGANSCRNYGFKLCKGKYIKWFDSDDFMQPNLMENQLNSIDENTDCSVCKVAYYDFENDRILKENTIYSNDLIKDYLVGKVAFYISGPLWSRRFLNNQKELFDEKIANLDDWDFNLRMLYQKPIIVYIEEPLIKYRVHETSLSAEIKKLNFNEVQSEFFAREKHVKLISKNKKANPTILKKFIRDRYKYFLREALIRKEEKRFYYLKILLKKQFGLSDYLGIVKTLFAVVAFSVLNKGYKILK